MNTVIRGLLTGLAVAVLTLACLEVTIRLFNINPKEEYIFDLPLTQHDKLLGRRLNPNIRNDSHPSARSYRAVALKLADDIGVAPHAAGSPLAAMNR